MKIINVGGYGNTGCTAQADFLGDHAGVIGVLPPFHELGVLKCFYSFGGIVNALNDKENFIPTREHLRLSLMGEDPLGKRPVTGGAAAHLGLRKRLADSYSDDYRRIINDALANLPERFNELAVEEVLKQFRVSFSVYASGLFQYRKPGEAEQLGVSQDELIIGFKNDPPGAFPVLAYLYPEGTMTSAILRDPRDTTFDFNRHYSLGHTFDKVQAHCRHYNAQINSARAQIKKYESLIQSRHIIIDFENLVQSESLRNRYRDKMIGKRERIRQQFNPELSAVNVGHYKELQPDFVDYIEKQTMDNYVTFRDFVRERELLVE